MGSDIKSNLIGLILVLGYFASIFIYSLIENIWLATLSVVVIVFLTSYVYLRISRLVTKTDLTTKFIKELFLTAIILLIYALPIICFGKIILVNERVDHPEIIVAGFVLQGVLLGLVIVVLEWHSTNKARELTNSEILEALKQIEDKLNVRIEGLYVIGEEESQGDINAYQMGLRKFKIFVTEKLLKTLNTEELIGVLAHEVAHASRKHTLKIFTLGIAAIIVEIVLLMFFLHRMRPVEAIIFTGFILSILEKVYLALQRRFEYEADLTGAKVVGKDVMISALRKLSALCGDKKSKLYEIYSDHPSFEKRIKRLQKMNISSQHD